jgi:hypothetical protein
MADIDSDDYFIVLSEEQLKNMTYAQAQAEFNRTVVVSGEVRSMCQAELAAAKKSGYKI